MANSHDNTKHTRLALRTAERIKMLADKRGLTKTTMTDVIVEDYLERNDPEILEATAHLPEPRRALPPAAAVIGSADAA